MRKLFLLTLAVLVLHGCGPKTITLTKSVKLKMAGRTLHIAREKEPAGFVATIPANAMLGLVGAVAAIGKGKAQMLQFGLVDPSLKQEDILADHVIRKFNLSGRGEVLQFDKGRTAEEVAEAAKRKGLTGIILDVQTLGWSYIYRLDLKYGIYYQGVARLVDIRTKKILSGHACVMDSSKVPGKQEVKYDEMVANNGAVLKDFLSTMATMCLSEYKTKAL